MNTKHFFPCLIDPLPSCAIWAGIFTGIDAAQGAPLSLRTWGFYTGGLWAYHALVCPLEGGCKLKRLLMIDCLAPAAQTLSLSNPWEEIGNAQCDSRGNSRLSGGFPGHHRRAFHKSVAASLDAQSCTCWGGSLRRNGRNTGGDRRQTHMMNQTEKDAQ